MSHLSFISFIFKGSSGKVCLVLLAGGRMGALQRTHDSLFWQSSDSPAVGGLGTLRTVATLGGGYCRAL